MMFCVFVLIVLSSTHSSQLVLAASNHELQEFFSEDHGTFELVNIPPTKQVIRSGSKLKLSCNVSRKERSMYVISWNSTNSRYLHPKNGFRDHGDFILKKATESDSGYYRCIVGSEKQAVITSINQVIVTDEMNFWAKYPSNLTVPFRSILRLQCSSQLFYEFEFCNNFQLTWMFKGQQILETKRHIISKCGILYIFNFGYVDEGRYWCEAYSDTTGETFISPFGEIKVRKSSKIEVRTNDSLGNDYVPSSRPLKIFFTPDVEALVGYDAILECLSNARTLKKNIKWSKKAKKVETLELEPLGEDDSALIDNLLVSNITVAKRGMYRCDIQDGKDHDFVQTRLRVFHPPQFVDFPSSLVVHNGRPAWFNCSANGNPAPTVQIFKNGNPILTDTDIMVKNPYKSPAFPNTTISYVHILLVKKEHVGIYQCIARNKAGEISKAIKMRFFVHQNDPEMPINIRVRSANGTSVVFAWDNPSSYESNIQYTYNAFLSKVGEQARDEVVFKREKTYANLEPNTNYSFSLRTIAIKDGLALLSDKSPDIYYYALPSEGVLKPEKPEVKLFARLEQNYRHFSRPRAAKRKKFKLRLLSNETTSIMVYWTLPQELIGKDNSFNLTYNDHFRADKTFYSLIRNVTEPYWIKDIEPSCYRFLLQVYPSTGQHRSLSHICTFMKGNKIAKKIEHFYMKSIELGDYEEDSFDKLSISEVKVSDVSSTSIRVNWIPDQGLDFDFFLVIAAYYKPHSIEFSSIIPLLSNIPKQVESNQIESKNSTNNDTTIASKTFVTDEYATIYHLKADTNYEILVAACKVNEIGSLVSAKYTVKTLEGRPNAPKDFKWRTLSPSSGNLSWTPTLLYPGDLLGYRLSYISVNGFNPQIRNSTGKQSSIILDGIISNTMYVVNITAITLIGESKFLKGNFSITAILNNSQRYSDRDTKAIVICTLTIFILTTCIIGIFLLIRISLIKRLQPSQQLNCQEMSRIADIKLSENPLYDSKCNCNHQLEVPLDNVEKNHLGGEKDLILPSNECTKDVQTEENERNIDNNLEEILDSSVSGDEHSESMELVSKAETHLSKSYCTNS